jgi:hypothetical protein
MMVKMTIPIKAMGGTSRTRMQVGWWMIGPGLQGVWGVQGVCGDHAGRACETATTWDFVTVGC